MSTGIFKKEYCLRNTDFDRFNCVKPSAVLDILQDAASNHAENLGIGFEDISARGYLWVIMKVKYVVLKQPEMYQRVTVTTWPKEAKRIDFERDYYVHDEQGNLLIKGTSQWALIDKITRRLVRVKDIYVNVDEYYNENAFEQKIERVQDFAGEKSNYNTAVSYSQLDANNHLNNIRYADLVLDALAPETPLKIEQMQIDFHKELRLNDKVEFNVLKEENTVFVKGICENEDMFLSSIKLKSE